MYNTWQRYLEMTVICTTTVAICESTGATMTVILDLPFAICIWISAAVAIIYTLMGGLYSVAYTDVVQLALMFISLVGLPRPWRQVLLVF